MVLWIWPKRHRSTKPSFVYLNITVQIVVLNWSMRKNYRFKLFTAFEAFYGSKGNIKWNVDTSKWINMNLSQKWISFDTDFKWKNGSKIGWIPRNFHFHLQAQIVIFEGNHTTWWPEWIHGKSRKPYIGWILKIPEKSTLFIISLISP